MNSNHYKNFWEKQALKLADQAHEMVSNLEADTALAALKIEKETEKINEWLGNITGKSILDLGAGTGQWSLKFSVAASKVVAVEYVDAMHQKAKELVALNDRSNITCIHANAVDYISSEKFDIIWISGLLIYISENELLKLLHNVNTYCNSHTRIIVRDGTALNSRYTITEKYSDALKEKYSADYRTANEYIQLFQSAGFDLVDHQDMFENGSPLNKWTETRLRIYEFKVRI